ncbi:hypothetical protein KSP40_PGU022639 [Platanthera guangdongensis]|uniref:Uncharacterized protein n=1 Tax=Platanthera guangdongensis TaxID=2320717 RepID=A0ABR2MDS2_9ASPA
MSQTPRIPEGSADTVEIGTIGTIGSLMSQELDTVNSVHASSSFRKKNSTAPISENERKNARKKGMGALVEIVDVKCNNPMSSRLKKLGFSKLSETIC